MVGSGGPNLIGSAMLPSKQNNGGIKFVGSAMTDKNLPNGGKGGINVKGSATVID